MKCHEESCDRNSYYNFPGEKGQVSCRLHRKKGMVVVCGCEVRGCKKNKNFGFPGKRARFCLSHKEKGMINVKCNRCEKCNKIPVYNFHGEKKGIFCNDHKEEYMINVYKNKGNNGNKAFTSHTWKEKNIPCINDNCNKIPNSEKTKFNREFDNNLEDRELLKDGLVEIKNYPDLLPIHKKNALEMISINYENIDDEVIENIDDEVIENVDKELKNDHKRGEKKMIQMCYYCESFESIDQRGLCYVCSFLDLSSSYLTP